MEKFLDFWSHYNAAIIESLVALIMVSVIYLAYRTFFGAKGPEAFDTAAVGGATIDTSHIEKTLQKILEQQQVTPKSASAPGDSKGVGAASAELQHEVINLKRSLEEKERHIVSLKDQVQAATKAAQQNATAGAAASAAPAAAAPGLSDTERTDYEAKIKELEARLSEYEIISEDIADVSFFKEENARLNRELEAFKSVGAPPAAPAPAPTIQAASTPSVAAAAAPVIDENAALIQEMTQPAPDASAEAMNAIDDSLMAEFAKAVESQKEGTLTEPPAQPAKSDEEAKLLEEFENFSKKS